jgi:hypothetical protein
MTTFIKNVEEMIENCVLNEFITNRTGRLIVKNIRSILNDYLKNNIVHKEMKRLDGANKRMRNQIRSLQRKNNKLKKIEQKYNELLTEKEIIKNFDSFERFDRVKQMKHMKQLNECNKRIRLDTDSLDSLNNLDNLDNSISTNSSDSETTETTVNTETTISEITIEDTESSFEDIEELKDNHKKELRKLMNLVDELECEREKIYYELNLFVNRCEENNCGCLSWFSFVVKIISFGIYVYIIISLYEHFMTQYNNGAYQCYENELYEMIQYVKNYNYSTFTNLTYFTNFTNFMDIEQFIKIDLSNYTPINQNNYSNYKFNVSQVIY